MPITDILGPERIAKGLFWTRPWSLVSGCTKCSPGCKNCWLESMAHRFPKGQPPGVVTPEGHWTGKIVTHPERLDLPLKTRKPQVFAIWSDLLHEGVPWQFIIEALNIMAQCERHIFLIITKRPERMKEIMFRLGESTPGDFAININLETLGHFGPNIYLLTTAENQHWADIRFPIALQIPAAVRIALVEPMLGPVDLEEWIWPGCRLSKEEHDKHCGGGEWCESVSLHGVIAGAETGPHARPAHPDWFRQVRDDCQAAGVPFFFKSWGEWAPVAPIYSDHEIDEEALDNSRFSSKRLETIDLNGKLWPEFQPPPGSWLMERVGKHAGRLLDGKEWNSLP